MSTTIESRPCARCGETLNYEGPSGQDLESADQGGGSMVCANGHLEAVDVNS